MKGGEEKLDRHDYIGFWGVMMIMMMGEEEEEEEEVKGGGGVDGNCYTRGVFIFF